MDNVVSVQQLSSDDVADSVPTPFRASQILFENAHTYMRTQASDLTTLICLTQGSDTMPAHNLSGSLSYQDHQTHIHTVKYYSFFELT